MSTLPLNPEFTSGALDRQVKDLLDEKYPPHVAVRNGVPYIPGQYIARFRFPNCKQPNSEQLLTRQEKPPFELPKWAEELLDGKQLEFKEIYRLTWWTQKHNHYTILEMINLLNYRPKPAHRPAGQPRTVL